MGTKKLGRIVRPSHRVTGDRRDWVNGAGWEFAHVAIDDHSRAGFVQMHADERKGSTTEFFKTTVARFAAQGVTIKRLLTDNGPADRSRLQQDLPSSCGIKHQAHLHAADQRQGRTLYPDLPARVGLRSTLAHKRETYFVVTGILDYYNNRRDHSALGYRPPASRIGGNNLLTINTQAVPDGCVPNASWRKSSVAVYRVSLSTVLTA